MGRSQLVCKTQGRYLLILYHHAFSYFSKTQDRKSFLTHAPKNLKPGFSRSATHIAVATGVRTKTFLWVRSAHPQKCPKRNGYGYILHQSVACGAPLKPCQSRKVQNAGQASVGGRKYLQTRFREGTSLRGAPSLNWVIYGV